MSSYPDQRLRTSAVGCEWTGRQYLGHIRFEIVQGLLRPRWLLPLPVTAFLAYLSAGRLRVDASNVGLGTGVFNQWDLLFHLFGNPYYVLYVLTPLFIYLAAGQAADRRLDSAVLTRVGSRRRWWAAKGLALGAASTVYTLLMFGLCAAIGVAGFGWEPTWSEGIRFFVSVDPYIVPGALLLSPGAAVIYLAGLLALGWLGLGMFALSVSLMTGQSAAGFGAGMLVLLAGIGGFHSGLSGPGAQLLVHSHLLFNAHLFGVGTPWWASIPWSCGFWTLWIAAAWLAGARWNLYRDVFGRDVDM